MNNSNNKTMVKGSNNNNLKDHPHNNNSNLVNLKSCHNSTLGVCNPNNPKWGYPPWVSSNPCPWAQV